MKKLGVKVILSISILVGLIVITLSAFSYGQAEKNLKEIKENLVEGSLSSQIHLVESYMLKELGEMNYDNNTLYDEKYQKVEEREDIIKQIYEWTHADVTLFVKEGSEFRRLLTTILNEDGTKAVGTNLDPASQAYEAAQKGENYTGTANILGKEYLAIYKPLKNDSGEVIGILFLGESQKNLDFLNHIIGKQKRGFMVLGVIFLAMGILIAYFMAGSIVNPIVRATKYSEEIAGLNLTTSLPEGILNRKDEIGILGKALSSISLELRNFIMHCEKISAKVHKNSEFLSEVTTSFSHSFSQIAQVTEGLAEADTIQSQNLAEGAMEVTSLGSLIEDSKNDISSLSLSAKKIIQLKEDGAEAIGNVIIHNRKSNELIENIQTIIMNTNAKVNHIKEASTLIENISRQTNLLALNASIEAARAGENGKGFAVVSEEVKVLAEQSAHITEQIKQIIDELTTESSSAVQMINSSFAIMEGQTQSIDEAKDKFTGISEAIDTTEKIVATVKENQEHMSKNKNKIVAMIEKLAAISEENTASTEEVAASIKSQDESLQDIKDLASDLNGVVERMNDQFKKFTL